MLIRMRRHTPAVCVVLGAVLSASASAAGVRRRVSDPDAMGAAFAQGVLDVEDYVRAQDAKVASEREHLEHLVAEWKQHTRSHPAAALGDQQSLRQRLQGETAQVLNIAYSQ